MLKLKNTRCFFQDTRSLLKIEKVNFFHHPNLNLENLVNA
ncbi:hypothetical protein WANA31_1186 [Wolbachia endosymbiont of Drosophila ananassae]|nr:hypothetical protein WANA31_1186 [Wolbachia endosymbiont of Drosophila ananassae]